MTTNHPTTQQPFSWRKRVKSFSYAFNGIKYLFATQHNARIHAAATIIVIIAAICFHISKIEWCAIAICIGGVIMAEAFNSAIELLADKITLKHDPLIGKAKDVAAAAVLVFVFAAIAVGLIIFLPKCINIFTNTSCVPS